MNPINLTVDNNNNLSVNENEVVQLPNQNNEDQTMRTENNNMALPRPHIPNNLCHVFCFQVNFQNNN